MKGSTQTIRAATSGIRRWHGVAETEPLNMAGPWPYNQVPIKNLQNDPVQLNRT
jgi:hypothetical protein